MIKYSSRRVDNKENDAKGVLFCYQMHRAPYTKVKLTLGANEKNGSYIYCVNEKQNMIGSVTEE